MLGSTKHDDMPITTHVSAVQALAVTIRTAQGWPSGTIPASAAM